MSILSTAIQARNIQNNFFNIQSQIDRLSGQIATGKVTDRFSGLGVEARRSLELRSIVTTTEQYQVNATRTDLLLQAQVNAINEINSIVDDALSLVTTQISGQFPDFALVQDTISASLREVISLMNTRTQDQFIFGGRGVLDQNVPAGQTAPVVFGIDVNDPNYVGPPAYTGIGSLPAGPQVNNFFTLMQSADFGLNGIGSNASGGINAADAGVRVDHIFDFTSPSSADPLSPAVPPGTITGGATGTAAGGADPTSPPFSVAPGSVPSYGQASFFNGDVPTATVAGAPANLVDLSAQIAEGIDLVYNTTIVDPRLPPGGTTGFQDILEALSVLATATPLNGGVGLTAADEQEFLQVYQNARNTLTQGQDKLRSQVSILGERQAFVERTTIRNVEVLTFTEIELSRIEDVDVAAASTELFQRQGQLEASFQIVSELRNLRLSNFLR